MRYNPNQTMYEEENSIFGRKTLYDFDGIFDAITALDLLYYFEFITRYDSSLRRIVTDTVIITADALDLILIDPEIEKRQDLKEQIEQLLLNMQTEGVDFLTHYIEFMDVPELNFNISKK